MVLGVLCLVAWWVVVADSGRARMALFRHEPYDGLPEWLVGFYEYAYFVSLPGSIVCVILSGFRRESVTLRVLAEAILVFALLIFILIP